MTHKSLLSRLLVYSHLLALYCIHVYDKSVNSRESSGRNLGTTLRFTKVESPGRDDADESSEISCKFRLLQLIKYILISVSLRGIHLYIRHLTVCKINFPMFILFMWYCIFQAIFNGKNIIATILFLQFYDLWKVAIIVNVSFTVFWKEPA